MLNGPPTKRLHLLQVSILGLAASFAFNGFVTNFLKVYIGRPRPDLLARCVPAAGTPTDQLVTVAVCTATDVKVLNEGFKSCPSGHSRISFSCLGFLAIWLCGQLGGLKEGTGIYKLLLSLM